MMKKQLKRYGLKRIAAVAAAVTMVFGTFTAVVATDDSTASTETKTVVVEDSNIKILGSINDNEQPKDALYEKGGTNGTNYTVDTSTGEDVYTAGVAYYKVLAPKNSGDVEIKTAFENAVQGYDKYVIEFDYYGENLDGDTKGEVSWHFRTIGVDANISIGALYNSRIKWNNGTNANYQSVKTAQEMDFARGVWHNMKLVTYLEPTIADGNVYKQEWIMDGTVIRQKTVTLANGIVPNYFWWCNKDMDEATDGLQPFFKYKNLRLYAAKDKTVNVADTTISRVPLMSMRDSYSNGKSIDGLTISKGAGYKKSDDGYMTFDSGNENIFININSYQWTKNDYEFIKSEIKKGPGAYSVKFDMYMPKKPDGAVKAIQEFTFLSDKVDNHLYFGKMKILSDRLKFENAFSGDTPSEVIVKNEAWHAIECVIEPALNSDDKVYMTWYVDGSVARAREELNTSQPNTSLTGLIKLFYGLKNEAGANQIKFDNFEISPIRYADLGSALTPTSLIMNDKTLTLSLNKPAENKQVLQNIAVKDSANNVITPQSVTVANDNKSVVITLPDNTAAEWYTVYLPERMFSADGYALSKSSVSTPHFEVASASFDDSADGKTSFKTTYKNSTNKETNIIAVIAAYDKTTGILTAVDTKTYKVNKSEDGAENVLEPNEFPTIDKGTNTTVKGFI